VTLQTEQFLGILRT